MTTIEILASFMKGNTKVTISDKQKSWLIGQAKREGVRVGFDGFNDSVYLSDCFYTIKPCKRLASGGSYVGARIVQGRYNIEKMFAIRFTENSKHTAVYGTTDLDHFRRENIGFEIIQP